MKLRLPKPGRWRDLLMLIVGVVVGAAVLDAANAVWIWINLPRFRAPFTQIERVVAYHELDNISEEELVRRYGPYGVPDKGSRFEEWNAAYIVGPGGWMPSQGKELLLLDLRDGMVVKAWLASGETGDLIKPPGTP